MTVLVKARIVCDSPRCRRNLLRDSSDGSWPSGNTSLAPYMRSSADDAGWTRRDDGDYCVGCSAKHRAPTLPPVPPAEGLVLKVVSGDTIEVAFLSTGASTHDGRWSCARAQVRIENFRLREDPSGRGERDRALLLQELGEGRTVCRVMTPTPHGGPLPPGYPGIISRVEVKADYGWRDLGARLVQAREAAGDEYPVCPLDTRA